MLKITHVCPLFDTFIPGILEFPLCLAFTQEPAPMEQPLLGKGAINSRVTNGTCHHSLPRSPGPQPPFPTHYPSPVNKICIVSTKYTSIWSLLSIFTANIQVNIILFSNYVNIFITKVPLLLSCIPTVYFPYRSLKDSFKTLSNTIMYLKKEDNFGT